MISLVLKSESIVLKSKIFNQFVLPLMTCGCEIWILKKKLEQNLLVTMNRYVEQKCKGKNARNEWMRKRQM